MINKQYNDGRSCTICSYFDTVYHEWDCSGTWTSESDCRMGHDLEETDVTDCEDFISNW